MEIVLSVACLVLGIALGFLGCGRVLTSSLSKGRLPKSLENLGFTLPEKYKKKE